MSINGPKTNLFPKLAHQNVIFVLWYINRLSFLFDFQQISHVRFFYPTFLIRKYHGILSMSQQPVVQKKSCGKIKDIYVRNILS